MYNLLEYSQSYSMTSGSLWNYYIDETNNFDDNASDGKSFKYKTKIIGKISQRPQRPGNEGNSNREVQPPIPSLNTECVVLLKYLSNF